VSEGPYSLDDYADEDGGGGERARRGARRTSTKSGLPKGLPEPGAPPAQFAAFLTEFARLDDDPVVAADRWGVEGSEPIELVLRSGRRVTWAEQDHLFGPRLQRPLVMVTGHRPRQLTPQDVQLAAWAIVQFATLRAQVTEADEFREFWASYQEGRSVVPVDRDDEVQMRAVLTRWRQLADAKGEDRPFVLVDVHTEERLIRRLDFCLHVRSMRRAPISWARLHGLARKVGWELDRFQYRPTQGGAPYVQAKVFIVPDGWGENA
jgi:hypothetical protein